MKNLETLSRKDKLNEVTKKDGNLKKRVLEAIKYVIANNMHCQYYTGSGRYIRLVSYMSEIDSLLYILGYKYNYGNDAPRKGSNGMYFIISKQAKETLRNLINS